MSYDFKLLGSYRAEAAAPVLTSAAVLAPGVVALKHSQVACLAFLVTTTVVSTAPVVITAKKRITTNSTTGEVVMGTLTIPAGTAAGTIVYRYLDEDLPSRSLRPGQVCIYEVTTAAAGGGAAGAGLPLPELWENPQTYANDPNTLEVFA